VTVESLEHLTGWGCLHAALEEIRASHRDGEKFFAEVFEQLDLMAAELCGQTKELAQRAAQECRQTAAAAENHERQIAEQVQQMAQQQSLLEQERMRLELELETVRNRAAELSESLAEQKRLWERQQAVWTDELKRMGCLLESMPRRLAEVLPAALSVQQEPGRKAVSPHIPAAAADPVFDSVIAQFQLLQKDLARRRANS